MRRWAVVATIVVTTASLLAGVSASATSARAKPAKVPVKPGSTWTLDLTGAGCESDSFAAHHAFTAVTGSSGDSGIYDRGARKLKMTWTAGSGSGAEFTGTWTRATDLYTGTYADAGQSGTATLVPVASGGCALVTTSVANDTFTLGGSDTDTATVTGEAAMTPTGGVHFYACPGATDPCTATSTGAVDLGTATLSGSGSVATATSSSFSPTATGDYCFDAVYSGDSHYPVAADGSTTGECVTVGTATAPGPAIGILALNKVGPHEVLGGGNGTFVVSGDLFLNTDVPDQMWSGSSEGYEWDDAIDAHVDSGVYVYGTIHSNDGIVNGQPLWPLDTCFESGGILGLGNPQPGDQVQYQAGDPGNQLPAQQMSCSAFGGSTTIDYDNIDPTEGQIDDPLQGGDAPPNPFDSGTDIACPGSAGTQVFSTVPAAVGGMTTLLPGEYPNPVELTGSTTFADCGNGYPGVYRFDQGLWINPGPGDSVTGENVVIATEAPYPMGGNVPGSGTGAAFVASGAGNGAPCLPSTTLTSAQSGHGTPEPETSTSVCGGTTDNGVLAYGDSTFVPDPKMSGSGNNFSLIIGGAAGDVVILTGPTTGAYAGGDGTTGIVLYQDPNAQANDGFDAESGDAATIAIDGVVYNASLTDYGADAPLDYWDGVGGGVPFYAGGTFQAGYGTGWSDGPAESGGSVTLTGTAVVDDFDTDGTTAMTLIGGPYALQGESTAVAGALASCRPSHERRSKGPKACRVRR